MVVTNFTFPRPAVDYRYKSTHSKESLDGCDTSHSPHPYPEIQARPVPSLGDLLSPRGSMEDLETEPLIIQPTALLL